MCLFECVLFSVTCLFSYLAQSQGSWHDGEAQESFSFQHEMASISMAPIIVDFTALQLLFVAVNSSGLDNQPVCRDEHQMSFSFAVVLFFVFFSFLCFCLQLNVSR